MFESTGVVLVMVDFWSADITHQSTLVLPISSNLAYYYTQDKHLDNTSGIRTHFIDYPHLQDSLWFEKGYRLHFYETEMAFTNIEDRFEL